jgi:hypothetical protein
MKKIFFLFSAIVLFQAAIAQVNIIDLASAIKKVGQEYNEDFKHYKGKLKTKDGDSLVYFSRFKLPGSIDSTNLIYQDKANKIWYFKAEMDRQTVSISELLSILPQVVFTFGNLKASNSGFEWISLFVPQSKRKVPDRVKNFVVYLYDGIKNPTDAKGQLLYIKIGGDNSYTGN